MPIKITKLIIKDPINKKTNKKHTKPGFFEFLLEFEISTKDSEKDYFDNNGFFDELLDYHKIVYLEDPIAYEKEIKGNVRKHKKDFVKALKAPIKQRWKNTYTRGLDIATKKGNKYILNEYFTYTPVTRGILTELKKMQKDPKYSMKTIPEQYLSHLLKSLSYFWD